MPLSSYPAKLRVESQGKVGFRVRVATPSLPWFKLAGHLGRLPKNGSLEMQENTAIKCDRKMEILPWLLIGISEWGRGGLNVLGRSRRARHFRAV